MYIKRNIESFLEKALKTFPVCLITGPRQAGKSTLLKHFLTHYSYVTLDDPMNASLANKDPELFLNSYPAPLIIDEIQYAPDLMRYIKIKVDNNRHIYGQYVLTGSQIFSLMKDVSESLAGRIAIFHLYPLSFAEIQPLFSKKTFRQSLFHYMIQGSYPEFFINPNIDRQLWFGSYASTYIERDVRNITAITDISRFQTFITLLAARAGQLLNLSEISKECGISQPTAKDWLSILESTYIIYLLKPFHTNLTKRLVKSPKIYFVDTGLLCYLTGISSQEQLIKAPQRGHIFENLVIMEYKKQLSLHKNNAQFFFYRTSNGVEVDLIIQIGFELTAYEIKFAQTLSKNMAYSLSLFKKDHPCRAQVLTLNEGTVPLKPDINAVYWFKNLFSDIDHTKME